MDQYTKEGLKDLAKFVALGCLLTAVFGPQVALPILLIIYLCCLFAGNVKGLILASIFIGLKHLPDLLRLLRK